MAELKNNTLDDVAAVIGFSATLRFSAWLGDSHPVYIPAVAETGQLITRLIGLSAAAALSKVWPREHLSIPRISQYADAVLQQRIAAMHEKGFSNKETARDLNVSPRRVQQIIAELASAGLLSVPKGASA